MKKKQFETRVWPGFWEGERPVINFKTEKQKLKISFLQRKGSDYVCVYKTGDQLIEYLDKSAYTEEKYYDSSGYYNWPIIKGMVLALQHDVMRSFGN